MRLITNKSLFSFTNAAIPSLLKGKGWKAGVLLSFLLLGFVGPFREARSDFGDEIKKWVGLGKLLGPEKKTETKPETNPSGTKTLSYSSSGTIEDVQKKSSSLHKSPPINSPPQNYYHCLSGCEGGCNFRDSMAVIRDGSTLELTLLNGNARGVIDPQGNISMKSENLNCRGKMSEDKLRLDCSAQNMSCQEVVYKI